jgi:hypothetical protein
MGRLKQLGVVDPVLTNLARGYSNEALVGEALFPVVTCEKEYGKIPQFGKEAFRIMDTERAIRAESNVLTPDDRDTIDFVMNEHDLAYPVDYREEDADMFNAEAHATMVVTELIKLKHEKECSEIAQTASNYATGNKVTLSGSDQFTHADCKPLKIIEAAKGDLKAKIGKNYLLTMLIGEVAFKALKENANLMDKIKYSMKGIITTDLLKEIFGVDQVVVGSSVYFDKATGKFVNLWADNVILAYVPKQASSRYEPSYGYTLRRKGMPYVDKYDGVGGKVHFVRNTTIQTVKLLSDVAGYLIADTNA